MINIVSGLPRSGTSLMMQMLSAGGLPVLSDNIRAADEDNARGYFEWEKIKQLPKNPGCIAEADGKVVKVVSALLPALPGAFSYRIIFMQRPLTEVVASQSAMIARRGTSGAPLRETELLGVFEKHLRQIAAWLETQPHIQACRVEYGQVLRDPIGEAQRVALFLDVPLNVNLMAQQIDVSKYRQRSAPMDA